MSRIYQPNKVSAPTKQPSSAAYEASSVITPNSVMSNVKLFSNSINSSNNSSRSSSPKVSSFALSSLSKQFDSSSSSSEEINFKLTKEPSPPAQPPVTNKLEILSKFIDTTELDLDEMSQEALTKLITRLESVANRLETIQIAQPNGVKHVSNGVNGHADTEEVHQSVTAFDDLLNSALKAFVTTSNEIGGDVKTIGNLVEGAFKYQRSFLLEASKCTLPAADVLQGFYAQFTKSIEEITSLRDKNRKSEFFNHLSAISESIGALGWIGVSPAPSPYVKEMSDSAQFYTNRVLKDFKEKDAKHVAWVRQWLQLLSELQAFVKQNHTTGVTWNSTKKSGKFDLSKVSSSGTTAPKSANGPPSGPPPPPLPNMSELMAADTNKKPEPKNDTDALFSAINRGCDITKGLKKVADDQKTHKNPNLRTSAFVPASASKTTATTSAKAVPVAKPPVFELDDKKWKIEFQNKRNDLVIDKTEIKHTVYIYKCKECTITVKGKVNSILIDSCNRVALLFDDVLSTVEFINSQSVQAQTLGQVPTVCIEKTDGCQVYLSNKSLNTEVVSSKSTAMNILIPNAAGDEFSECPIPEQFRTVISKDNKLKTVATDN